MSLEKHYVRDCIVFESVKKSKKKMINVVSIVSIQIVKNKSTLQYFFILITLYVNTIMITIKIMIDNKSIRNFIFQFKIKKHKFVEIDTQIQNFRYFDNIVFKTCKFHNLNVDVINQQKFLKVNIIDVNMILKMSFLQNVNFIID